MNIKIDANKRNYVLNANRLTATTSAQTITSYDTRVTTDGDTRATTDGDTRIITIENTVYPASLTANKRNYVLNAPLIKVQ